MNWNKFLTYGDSLEHSFETLCNQIFEHFLVRRHSSNLTKFRVINGAGGDGGIEAYGELISGDIVAIQAKWFRHPLKEGEISQIRKSVTTAMKLRPKIREYIICIPHNVSSLKFGRGKKDEEKKPIENYEERTTEEFMKELAALYPNLTVTWWFEKDIELELQQSGNEGIYKFWFDREIMSIQTLSKKFALERTGWLNERYIPELHGHGQIRQEYEKVCFSWRFRAEMQNSLKKIVSDLDSCVALIEQFTSLNSARPLINNELERLGLGLMNYLNALKSCQIAYEKGNDFHCVEELPDLDVWTIFGNLKEVKADNLQKNNLPKLRAALEKIHRHNLKTLLDFLRLSFRQYVKLVIGDPGTGKTHGLANCVESHLAQKSPAIIVQAKGSSARNWSDLLSRALELSGWQKDEILSALEALAVRCDVHKVTSTNAGEETTSELTKVLICIDGLDEDSDHFDDWYSRIRESVQLSMDHPRVRFIFSARRYFYNNQKLPDRGFFEDITLPHEGDVRIADVAPKYFSKEHYNIKIEAPSIIRGINSLLALRLFCDEYRNRRISETDEVVTATRDLINLKIERVNKEFVALLGRSIGSTRSPVLDALSVIADHFYQAPTIEHNQLVKILIGKLGGYLDSAGLESLVDYMAQNGFLIRSETVSGAVLKRKQFFYSITYQSVVEHIISEEIYEQIRDGSLSRIPEFLHRPMARPVGQALSPFEMRPNERIIQSIVTNLLLETGKLIGIDGFLIEGFDDVEVIKLQLTAIAQSPAMVAENFRAFIDKMFDNGYLSLSYLVEYLILPSSYSPEATFGAEYLHAKLIPMSTFERDKKWSGLDRHEEGMLSDDERHHYQYELGDLLFTGNTRHSIELYGWNLHNDRPLVIAWGLSTIDQDLRHKLRVALTTWAIQNPPEFLLLLRKVFHCNDPQIQEDLASIALGVASRIKEPFLLQPLALWAEENIFGQLQLHRNIIVRQGFRAIVERAYQCGSISQEAADRARPKPMNRILLLPLAEDLEIGHQGDCYPIVHDLAWYVIKDSYNKFLELPTSAEGTLADNDCPEAKILLDQYRKLYGEPSLFAYRWALAAAIAYIRNLGFTRRDGNHFTQATHGSKSKVFTYEEKYTWLAVHYLQGYLADYVPAEDWSGNRTFIKDYSQLTDMPNPAESLVDGAMVKSVTKNEWVIKERLSKELETSGGIKEAITNWVNEEPSFDPDNWLRFDSTDFFPDAEDNKKWTAILNHTALHDSEQYCYSRLDARACLVRENDLQALTKVISVNPDSLHFITHLDGFHASPATDTYSNPTDIVWMTWIDEDGATETFYDDTSDDERRLKHTLTQVVQTGISGETYWILPSKEVRSLVGCYDFVNGELRDINGETRAFVHKSTDGNYDDNQQMVLIDEEALRTIKAAGYELVWFFEHFKEKNPLDKSEDKDFHVQKVRKYLVRPGKIKGWEVYKFWDEWASNVRDKDLREDAELYNPFKDNEM